MMQYRRIGRTSVELSVVGLGAAQLQLLPRRQAVDALTRGFAAGVNWIHCAPDYGEVEAWIAEAIAASGLAVHVLAQGPGPLSLLDTYFEHTARTFGRPGLAMYGLGCIDDLERVGENVWGPGGMIELLQRKKSEGRLDGIFCTTHGTAEYVSGLVRSGVFDAIMVAYNPLGFHLLTYNPPPEEGRTFEHIPDFPTVLFPVAEQHRVSILVMKALGGGLLAKGRAFPPHEWLASPAPPLSPGDLIRYVLGEPAVSAVVAGFASGEEAEEDALAGHAPLTLPPERRALVDRAVAQMRQTLCSRCGACESTCSKALPISFMFRDAYIWNYRTEVSMADDRFGYFRLHPDAGLACATCEERTCICPHGLDIPASLARVHARVHQLVADGRHPGRSAAAAAPDAAHQVRVLSTEVPSHMTAGTPGVARFVVENTGSTVWLAPQHARTRRAAVALAASADGRLAGSTAFRQNVSPGQHAHVLVEFVAPSQPGIYDFAVDLRPLGGSAAGRTTNVYRRPLRVDPRTSHGIGQAARRGARVLRHVAGKLRGVRSAGIRSSIPGSRRDEVRFVSHTIPNRLVSGVTSGYQVTIENTGSRVWRSTAPDGRSIDVVISMDDVTYAVVPLPQPTVAPGERVTVHFALQPPAGEGRHSVCLELVERPGVRLRYDGAPSLRLDIEVERRPAGASAPLSALALQHNLWYYQPTQGIQHAADGRTYPLFIEKSKGCRVWDVEGREYIDYSMSWGATLLGHADDRVQEAIRRKLDSGPLPPFPDPLEMEVSRLLIEDFPGAEMVVFGKNGSDVCSVAARLARLVTGKRVILSCGFHGWQDFALGHFPFDASGIPAGARQPFYKFGFNDREDFFRLYREHRDDLAAVMIEPGGPFVGPDDGMAGDADPGFLEEISAAARRAGALVIFDEIITGYRYTKHSVQRALGIVPDLTCLGKALASGMPLSALVGRARIFHQAFARTHYCPTFKGEVYSFAAARAAIDIYRAEPVVEHVWSHGETLRAGIHALARDARLSLVCTGPPFRMALHFPGADRSAARLKRTLLMQELLKGGVITVTGVMLPSYAHDEPVLRRTLDAIGAAMEMIAAADRAGDLHRQIEIPLL